MNDSDEKKTNAESPSISSYTKEEYESFLEGFFLLAYRKSKAITRMALLNADWRDFESTPASKENPDNSITIFDYHRILTKTGWKVTHRIECPPCPVEPGSLPRVFNRGVLRTPERKPSAENAGQTYFRNRRKNPADRKKIIIADPAPR